MVNSLIRYGHGSDSTMGLMLMDGEFECYTLEDQHQNVKVAGKTRIPAGIYEINFRSVLSPLTMKYRRRFDWFHYHLELQDVPGFEFVYIHIGNDADDTNACILVGDKSNNNQMNRGFISHSTQAFERVYKKISSQLLNGNRVFIQIKDISA